MKTYLIAASGLALGIVLAGAQPVAAECGQITVADMNWPSASFAAHVDKIVLEEGYGCEVQMVPGDTVPTVTSMAEKGEPDVAPEVWANSVREVLDAAVAEGRLRYAGKVLTEGGVEGWWIPQYVKDAYPEIVTIEDALARSDLFAHPEYTDLGGVYTCPSGWGCQLINGNLFRAYGGEDKNFELVDPGSAAGLDGALINAYEREEPWLGYYWSPTAIMGRYAMLRLDFGVGHDPDHWRECTSIEDCPDPRPNAWVTAYVATVVTSRFAEASSDGLAYIEARGWPNDVINEILVYMDDNQAEGEDAAWYFLEEYPDVWAAWLSDDAAAKVRAAIEG